MLIAFDTETEPFAPGAMTPPVVCTAIANDRGVAFVDPRELAWDRATWIGHHVAYDTLGLITSFPELRDPILDAYSQGRIRDSMLLARLRHIEEGSLKDFESFSLASCSERYLDRPLPKDENLRRSFRRGVPLTREQAAYALYDARTTFDLYAKLGELNPLEEARQARAAFALQVASARGMLTDGEHVERMRVRFQAEQDALALYLQACGLLRPDGTRNVGAARDRLRAAYGDACPLTDGGAPSLSREACENSRDPVLKKWARYAQLNAWIGKDLSALSAPILHTWFQTLAASGRTSSSKPNVQNFPREHGFREAIIPRPGHCFVVLDYKGLELATLAYACLEILGVSKLAEMLRAFVDPHGVIGALLLHTTLEDLAARRKADDQEAENARQTGKVVNFGCPGGLGADALVHYAQQSYSVILTPGEAKYVKQVWLSAFPEMRGYFDHVARIAEGDGRIEQLVSGRVRGGVGFCDGCNTYFQGLGADIAKEALWSLVYATFGSGPLARSHVVNFVHDEFVIECPIEECHEVAGAARDILRLTGARWLGKHRIPLDVEYAAMARYSKKVKPTFEDGRLQVTK